MSSMNFMEKLLDGAEVEWKTLGEVAEYSPTRVDAENVRILDAFTELTSELTARKKQYEYYRDLLLSFPKPEEAA